MTIRDERAQAVRRRWRDLQDNLVRELPRLLDDLDAIDERYRDDAPSEQVSEPDPGASPKRKPPATRGSRRRS